MTQHWTFRDYQAGECELHMVNTPKPEVEPEAPPPPPDDLPEDADFVFERELLEYRRDPSAYKVRHAPAVVNKLMEVDERRRAEQREQKQQHGKETPVELLPTHVLQARVRETIIQLNAEGFQLLPMLERGLEHIVSLPGLEDRKKAAKIMLETISRMATGDD